MSNTISPFGARDYVHAGGSQRTEELTVAFIMSSDATPIFNGDLVQVNNPVSSALGTTGYGRYVTQGCSGSGRWVGVFRGCEYYSAAQNRILFSPYWPGTGATGDVKAYLVTDVDQKFLIQGSSMAAIGSSATGLAFAVAVGGALGGSASAGGNTTTGISGMSLASSVAGAAPSSAYPFTLYDFWSNRGPGGVMGLGGLVPSAGSTLANNYVNGLDNASAGAWLIVAPQGWVGRGW